MDIGIVGAGACGLVAAHAAARDDLRVVVWEKAKSAGGSTALSNGMVPAAGTRMQREAGIFETAEEFLHDVLARNSGRSDPALTRRLCESSAALVEWLVDTPRLRLELVRHVCDPGHRQLRLHAPPSRTGQSLVDDLLRSVERRGIHLRLGTPVLQLWTDADGAVLGVQIKTPKKTSANIRCAKLVLATDGFGASADLLTQHCPDASRLAYAGAPTCDGNALAWASDIGAATHDLGAYDAYPTVAVGSNLFIPWGLLANGAILVNQRGERFADETRPAALIGPVRSQPGSVAYEIFDARILKVVGSEDPHVANNVLPRVVRRADDVTALAKQFQIDPGTLASAIATYNAAVIGGGDPFGRVAFTSPLTPPLYGIRVGAALLQTQGGLAIDPSARVLRPDGALIPNLYAGGGAAVGISGPGGDGYLLGNGLLCALGWGKIAGEQAAHEVMAARASVAHEVPVPEPEREPGD